ncbi:MAG TPA: glucosamine-6-phosphate deaminase [Cytophagales bacterium]|jgi:glucosamine-6-phosphate isomerase|nr:glucosamine-6-phosphate deaminase [Cytophagales bacterium]
MIDSIALYFSLDMEIKKFTDYESLSDFAATAIVDAIKKKPTLTLCMASGHSPARTAELLVQKLKTEKVDYSLINFIGLDEWVGLSPTNEGSCRYFFQSKLIDPLGLKPHQYFFFDAMANDLNDQCKRMDEVIDRLGIDIMLVGIGMNGHIGFNEPGTSFHIRCHVADLEETTQSVGQKYFATPMKLTQGITVGLKHLLNAKQVFLLANGTKKAEVIQQAVDGKVDEKFPASILQQHSNATIIIDEEAAARLTIRA